MNQNPWKWHVNIVWSHFQQFLHYGMLEFMLAPLTEAMKLPTLKLQLIIFLAEDPFCKFQMLIQTIAISDLGETLHTYGFDATLMLLKI